MVVAILGSASARAAEPPVDDKTAQAKLLWQEANTHYAVGEYNDAGEKYQAAYKLKADPALLYNAAQAYRQGGNNEKALLLYKHYVMFYPSAKNVAKVQQQIQKLQEAIAASEKAKTQPPTGAETESVGGGTTAPGGPEAASATSANAGSARPPTAGGPALPAAAAAGGDTSPPLLSANGHVEPQGRPVYKRWWFWTAVGGAVAAGVVAAVLLSSRSSGSWATGPDFGPGAASP